MVNVKDSIYLWGEKLTDYYKYIYKCICVINENN